MPAFSYLTISGSSEGLYKEKGSKFIALAFPVDSGQSAKEKLEASRKIYFDARHHCYAWILGPDKSEFRANDDGEPNHSAGDPILGQLRSRNLTNVLVIVVRYFGGVKLGVGGLIQAYRNATEDALSRAKVIEVEVVRRIQLSWHFEATPEVMRLVKEFDLSIQDQQYAEGGTLQAEMKLRVRNSVLEKVNLLQALGTELQITELTSTA